MIPCSASGSLPLAPVAVFSPRSPLTAAAPALPQFIHYKPAQGECKRSRLRCCSNCNKGRRKCNNKWRNSFNRWEGSLNKSAAFAPTCSALNGCLSVKNCW